MKITRWIQCAFVAVALLPTQLAAQERAVTPVPNRTESAVTLEALSNVEIVPQALALRPVTTQPTVPQLRGESGRTYMIAGAAALIGGLLIGGDVGTLLAAGGVVLGVYGILLYY